MEVAASTFNPLILRYPLEWASTGISLMVMVEEDGVDPRPITFS